MPKPDNQAALLNHWNARRHAQDRLQAGARRAAERIARRATTEPHTDEPLPGEARTPDGPA